MYFTIAFSYRIEIIYNFIEEQEQEQEVGKGLAGGYFQ